MIADRIGIYIFISYIENEYPAKPDGQEYIIIIGMGFCQLFTLYILLPTTFTEELFMRKKYKDGSCPKKNLI